MFKVEIGADRATGEHVRSVYRLYLDYIDYRPYESAFIREEFPRYERMTFTSRDLADLFASRDEYDYSLVNRDGKIAKRLAKSASAALCFDVVEAFPDEWSRAVNEGLSELFGKRTANVELINQFDGRVSVYKTDTCYWNPSYFGMWRAGIDACPSAGLVHFTNDSGAAIGRLWYELAEDDNGDPALVLWNSYGKNMTIGFMHEAARQAALAKRWITEDHRKFKLDDDDYIDFDGHINGDLYVFALGEPDAVYSNICETDDHGRKCANCCVPIADDSAYYLESADEELCESCYYMLASCAICDEPYNDHDLQHAVDSNGNAVLVCYVCAGGLAACGNCGMTCVDALYIDGLHVCANCASDAEPCDCCGDLSLELCVVGNGQHGIARLCNLCFHDAPTDSDGRYLFTVANGVVVWGDNG